MAGAETPQSREETLARPVHDAQPLLPGSQHEEESAALAPLRRALEARGCGATEVLEYEQRWIAACGTGTVLVFRRGDSGGFALIEQRETSGEARAVFVRNGLVWVEVLHTEARPLGELVARPAEQPAPARSLVAPPEGAVGPTPRASLPREHESDSAVAPSRIGGVLMLEAGVRPFLPLDELAFAGIGDLAATYRGERPWYAEARLSPLGGFVGKGRDTGLFGASASAGYDHPLFSVGLGVGVLKRADLEYRSAPTGEWSEELDEGMAFAVSQSARLGALDGLSLSLTNAFVLNDDRWRFGMIDVKAQVPVGRRTWIVGAGGGGEQAGLFYAELALKRLVRGDRGSGSLFVQPSVGVAGIDTYDDSMVPGPMVGVRLEWRR